MLKNNCQCDLCRSVWGEPAHKEEQDKLTRTEDRIAASFEPPYPSILASAVDTTVRSSLIGASV